MTIRHLMIFFILAAFVFSIPSFDPRPAEAAQSTVKKKKQKIDQRKPRHGHGKKKYPWGEPNAGWEDRCIFYYDAYDGWIPPFCRPYGRTY